MGKIDNEARDYLSKNDRFADVFNFYLYGGEPRIDPASLMDLDSALITVPYGSGARTPVTRYRDVFRAWQVIRTDGTTIYAVALGGELQNKIHYAMPVKAGMYDFMHYAKQVQEAENSYRLEKKKGDNKDGGESTSKDENGNAGINKNGNTSSNEDGDADINENDDTVVNEDGTDTTGKITVSSAEYLSGFHKGDKLMPVITLTIYLGADEWDGPLSIKKMLKTDDQRVLELVQDYKVHLISPFQLSDADLAKFTSDFRALMEYIKYSEDWKKLIDVTHNDKMFRSLAPDAASLMNLVTNSKLKFEVNEKEGTVNVCKAISDLVENARVKEREEAEKKVEDAEKKIADVEKKIADAEKKREDAEKQREEAEKRAEKTEKILEVALKALREKGETDSDISKLVASVSAGV